MKGRKLTLQEVLQLEDGSKVWVEDSRRMFSDELCSYNSESLLLELIRNKDFRYNLNYIEVYEGKLTFYEWIDDSDIVEIKSNVPIRCSTCYSLATEILNLRSLDFTDENIEKIIKEFSEVE